MLSLPMTPAEISQRLKAKITKFEFFALSFVICFALFFVYLAYTEGAFPYDYFNYRNAAMGDPSFYYYGYWALPYFSLLNIFPNPLQLVIYFSVNIAAVYFASRMFGGKLTLVLLSYQFLYGIYFGQLTGFVVGGMALLWWGIVNKRWNIAGLGLIILLTKFQIGITIGLTFYLIANISWSDRFRILVVPIIIGLLSIVIYGLWPLEVLHRITVGNPPNNWASVSLWRWVGPAASILWLPVLLLPLSPTRRVIAIIVTSALAFPYFQQADLVALYVFPIGWIAVLGNIGLLSFVFQFAILPIVVVVPIVTYVWVISSHIRENGFSFYIIRRQS